MRLLGTVGMAVRAGALGLFLGGALPAVAFADGDSDAQRLKAAAEEFDAGRRAFKAKDFAIAAEHFENANRDAPAQEALRSAMRARKEAKQDARAATLAELALIRYPDDKPTVTLAKQILGPAEKTLHQVTVHCDSPCTLVVDRKLSPWGESKDAVVWVEPGAHTFVASWGESRDQKGDVTATASGKSELSLRAPVREKPPVAAITPSATAAPSAEIPPPAEPARSGLPRGVFYGAAGLTVVLAGVSVWSAVAMRSNPGKDKVERDCVNQGASCPTFQDALGAQHRTDALVIATGIVAVGTGVLGGFFTDWKGEKSPSAARAVPALAVGQGVVVGAAGRF